MSEELRKAAEQALKALERYQVKRQDFDRFADEVNALRAALADQTPPPRFSELLEIYRQAHPVERLTKGNPYVRAVESALCAKLGIKDQEGGAA